MNSVSRVLSAGRVGAERCHDWSEGRTLELTTCRIQMEDDSAADAA